MDNLKPTFRGNIMFSHSTDCISRKNMADKDVSTLKVRILSCREISVSDQLFQMVYYCGTWNWSRQYLKVKFLRHGKYTACSNKRCSVITCRKWADDLLKLNRHQLKTAVALLTGHAPMRGHLRIIGLFNEDPSCRFCEIETETAQHITCSCEALSRQRYNVFGKPLVEPKEISTAWVRDLCLFIRAAGILNLCWNI
jgi:hypothetical protein